LWSKDGFEFGYIYSAEREKYVRLKYPIFLAPSADVIYGLMVSGNIDKPEQKKYLAVLDRAQDSSGGFRTALGLNGKNNPNFILKKPCWRDVLHVVGWNDKVLRLYSLLLEEGSSITDIKEFNPDKISCEDALYIETKEAIRIAGREQYVFDKQKIFSNNATFLKNIFYNLGNKKHFSGRINSKLFEFLCRAEEKILGVVNNGAGESNT